MDWSLMFPSEYLKSAQFQGKDVTMTIESVALEELEGMTGKKLKGIVKFRERPLKWVLNRTNASALVAMFGRETDSWVGKRVTLWPAPFTDPQTGEPMTAIRVRGSPSIEADVSFELKLPRKKPVQVHLKKTA